MAKESLDKVAAVSSGEKLSPEKEIAALLANPLPALLRDGEVRGELNLAPAQAKLIDKLVADADYPIWRLRDAKDAESAKAANGFMQQLREGLAKTLQPPQEKRLGEILLRTQGWPGLVSPPVSDRLKLTSTQVDKLQSILKDAREAVPPTAEFVVQRQVQGALTETQKQTLTQMAGKPFDASLVRKRYCEAPEIDAVDEWINSPPLTREKLRGKVNVVTFWTFGCINCVHNLPHYHAWHEKYADRGLVLLGFHTPETPGEGKIENVKRNVMERDIKYAVAIDNSGKNWYAYANNLWPSTYLIDKQGFIRYWWSGELNWEGAKGEEWMRAKIEELLAEK